MRKKSRNIDTSHLGGLGAAMWLFWASMVFMAMMFVSCASVVPDAARGLIIKALTTDAEVFKTSQHNLCYEGGSITFDGTFVGSAGESSIEEVLGGWKVIADSATIRNYAIVDNCLVMLPREVE